MTSAEEDKIWRSIVENYGERALPDPERRAPRPEGALPPDETLADETLAGETSAFDPAPESPPSASDRAADALEEDGPSAQFVPAPVELSRPTAPRAVAWTGVLGVPVAFFLLALLGRTMGGTAALVLLAWFMGSFCYLVWTMPKEPPDPFDDGSRV